MFSYLCLINYFNVCLFDFYHYITSTQFPLGHTLITLRTILSLLVILYYSKIELLTGWKPRPPDSVHLPLVQARTLKHGGVVVCFISNNHLYSLYFWVLHHLFRCLQPVNILYSCNYYFLIVWIFWVFYIMLSETYSNSYFC